MTSSAWGAEWSLGEPRPEGSITVLDAQAKAVLQPGEKLELTLGVPEGLAAEGWRFSRRTWTAPPQPPAELVWEELAPESYQLTLGSSAGEEEPVVVSLRFALSRDGKRLPLPGRLLLLAPRPGTTVLSDADNLLLRWASAGSTFRIRLESSGGTVLRRVVLEKKQFPLALTLFEEPGKYRLLLEHADDSLAFGEPLTRTLEVEKEAVHGERQCPRCRGRGLVTIEERCATCNATGRIAAGRQSTQVCPYCKGTGRRKTMGPCPRCGGIGKLTEDYFQCSILVR
jgi:hypothetical protein